MGRRPHQVKLEPPTRGVATNGTGGLDDEKQLFPKPAEFCFSRWRRGDLRVLPWPPAPLSRVPARWVRVPRLESISPVFPSASSDGYRQTHFFTKRYFSSSARRHASARVGKKGTLTTSEHCVCGGVGTRAAFSRVFRRTPRSRNRFGRCRRQKSIGNAIGVSISHPISYLCRFFGGRRLR